ncbi:hypothetical protein B0T18DRAFT_100696 [Schizothecium vesticola]|uniref:Uncharacterized protein n=1 Tax=Schizothecium vesticola TaxID=314040 RepID=A0AA40F100_9PEZI|nr:hypothetical protein B0T18DRAFT_100696 [Schizothecium vesticola]
MGDTGLGRHRRSSGSQASVVIRIRRRAFPASGGRARHVLQSRQTQATCMATFSGSRRHGIQRKGLGNGFRHTRTEKIGAPFPSARGVQNKSHAHRENIGSGGGSITGFFADAHKTGTHYWAIYTGLHLLDIFSTLGGSHTFLFSRGTSTFFCFSSRSRSPPKALGVDWRPSLGWEDLGGFRMAWKPGKGEGEGGLFLSLGNPQGAWLRLALGIFVGSGCFSWFLGRRR